MRIAAVVIAHDVAPWIRQALESVLRQTRRPDLIVVVENGSGDGTREEIRSTLRDLSPPQGLVLALFEPALGPGGARNLGIRHALEWGAEAVAFLDGDDWWSPSFLRSLEPELADDDVVAVFGCAMVRDQAGRPRSLRPRLRRRYDYRDLCWRKSPMVTTSALVVRAAALERVGGFRTDIYSGEDWELLLRLVRDGGAVACVRRFLVNYRKRPGSLTSAAKDSLRGLEAVEAAHPEVRHAKHWWWPLNQALRAGQAELAARIRAERPEVGARDYLSPQFLRYLALRLRGVSPPRDAGDG